MNAQRYRNGFTMVELMITMSAASALMVLAIGLVHRAMLLESRGQQRADTHRTATRLSNQFRRDIHAGLTVSIEVNSDREKNETSTTDSPSDISLTQDAAQTTLRIDLPGQGKITYRTDGPLVTRTRRNAEESVHREEYRFSPGDHAVIEALSPAEGIAPERIRLKIVRTTELDPTRPRIEVHLEVVVGRLGKLQVKPPGTETANVKPGEGNG
jgi:prepilin-type N-terminal cleavage/methylation domain-containing protein